MKFPSRTRPNSTARGASAQRRGGVTLIEAIAVILLLSAAAVSSAMYFDGDYVARRQVNLATHQVSDALRVARLTAIEDQTNINVRRLRSRGIQSLRFTEAAGPFRDQRAWDITLTEPIRIDGTPTDFTFEPTGSVNRECRWSVEQNGVAGKVSIAPVSGKISRSLP